MSEKIYRVHCLESERGWGQEFYSVDFDTRKDAWEYFKEVNSKNTSPTAPDYYVVALRIEELEE